MAPQLSTHSLTVAYGQILALRDVSLEVAEGEAVALIGANGAGKSSLLRAVSGLTRPIGGAIRFNGADVTGADPFTLARLGMAHVPEGRRVFSRMTVRDNLLIGAYGRRDPLGADLDRVQDLFPRLRERRSQMAGTLSGGEQQMLAIARALMGRPRLLLLDEPSLGLSPILIQAVYRAIAALHREGTSLLLVEQNARQALRLASRAYVLRAGELQLSGPSTALAADERVQQMYLGSLAPGTGGAGHEPHRVTSQSEGASAATKEVQQ